MCYRLLDVETSPIYVRRDVVFNKQDFGPGTKRVSRRSLTETLEVQPSSDDILKWEKQDKPLPKEQSDPIQTPVRYGIDECIDAAVDSVQHHAYPVCQIVEPQGMQEALPDDCQRSGSKQPMLSMPHSYKMIPGTLWSYQVKYKLLEARSRVEVTGRRNNSKLGSFWRATRRSMGLVTTRPFHQFWCFN